MVRQKMNNLHFLAKYKMSAKISFLKEFPNLENEWDWEENNKNNLFPEKLSKGSHKKVWWICSKNNHHKWEAMVQNRTLKKSKCPYCVNQKICACGCNSVYETNPELRNEWNWKENKDMKIYAPNSGKKVWWICLKNNHHKWEASINHRTGKGKTGCPYCVNQKICACGCNSVYESNPELRNEWDPQNEDMKTYAPSSNEKVWWICLKNDHHKWEASISHRTGEDKTGCPYCVNKIICACGCNSVYESNPELRNEWDPQNEDMKTYAPSSGKKVWWICPKNDHHKWEATIDKRTGKDKSGCPYCNSLYELYPELQNEWDEEKNGDMKTYGPSSGKKVWWICPKNDHHKWEAIISNRTKIGCGCSFCCNRKICVCGCNSVYESNPELRNEWDPQNEDMKTYAPNSNKKVFWICPKNNDHKWKTMIANRTGKGKTGCPHCRQSKLEKAIEKACVSLGFKHTPQKTYDDTKNINYLPYDACIEFPSLGEEKYIKCDVEAQGIQHFEYTDFFHRTYDFFRDRLTSDAKKLYKSYVRKNAFLAISYLCLDDIETIIKDFGEAVKTNPHLIRLYLTKNSFLEMNDSLSFLLHSDLSIENLLLDDSICSIYSIYSANVENLLSKCENRLQENNCVLFDFCECVHCDSMYLKKYVNLHYKTNEHRHCVQEDHDSKDEEGSIFAIGEDGEPWVVIDEPE